MKNRRIKKLLLHAETVRHLEDLGAVAGGNPTEASVCKMASLCVACSDSCRPC